MSKPAHDQAAYKGMLKATSTLAGAKVVTILISIVKTKLVASLLGPAGIGIVSLVTSSTDLARVAFGCGLDNATARRVAEVSGNDDPRCLDHTFRVSARTALLAGIAACLALLVASPFLSAKFLGDSGKFWWYGLGALSLIFTPMLGVELAFLQGLRKSKDLASCQIIASFCGAVLNVLLISLFGVVGGLVAFLPFAMLSLFVHHTFLKRHRPVIPKPREAVTLHQSANLLKLGSGFAVNGIWLTASGWLNLLFITRYYGTVEGPHQIGLYMSAAIMANLYIGIIVSSMATEFYPALVQAAKDRDLMKRLLNQQTMLAVTLGIPATMGLMIFAPWVLQLLYTKDFSAGAPVLRWLLAGMAIRFLSCPLGFALLAIGSPRAIVISELAMGAVMITSSYILLQYFGLVGLGMALVSTNLLYLLGIIIATHRMNVHWNQKTVWLLTETLLVLSFALILALRVQPPLSLVMGGTAIAAYTAHLLYILQKDSGLSLSMLLSKLRNITKR